MVIIMPEIYMIKGYKARSAEKRLMGVSLGENQEQTWKTSSPSGVTQDMFNLPSEEL